MQTKVIFFFGLLSLTTLALPGCSEMNTEEQQQSASTELPIAPVLPSYINLAPTAPPAAPYEIPPMIGDLQHQTWRPGYFSYDDGKFTWMPGTVIAKPAFTAVWMPDHWEKREFGWAFVAGYWQ